MIETLLVDRRNFDKVAPAVLTAVSSTPFIGLDCETEDSRRHPGIKAYCGYDEKGFKAKNSKTVFDFRRTTMTGFSLWPEDHSLAYYLNLNHADVENRIPWSEAKVLLDALPADSHFICHHASFELTAFGSCYSYPLPRTICSLQMAVSAYGPDEYRTDVFQDAQLGAMIPLLQKIKVASFTGWNPLNKEMSPELAELVYKIIAKESDAAHSYNGFIKSITYGYGLKQAIKSFFGHTMTTYEQVLNGKAHMGQLTGEDTASYGAEDAYWAVRLFRHLLGYMARVCPESIPTFFEQENPMVEVYSDIWRGGMKVNSQAVYARRDQEREDMAQVLRDMKATVRSLLPFSDRPHEKLMTVDTAWYTKNWQKYRKQIESWASTPDLSDSYGQCQQVRGPVSNAWATEMGKPESRGVNLQHYMPMRTMIYDLLQQKLIMSEGKTQSDGEARGRLKDRLAKADHKLGTTLLDSLAKIAGIEQRVKLYLTPYTLLMDPDTGRMYPNVSSMLASRRMAASYPNPMQLAKRGESTYVRGFFEPDERDHVMVSIDWSGIELVEIGEFSGDPEFLKAYGQIPHEDLHAGAAADILAVDVPGLNEAIFKDLSRIEKFETFRERYGTVLDNVERLESNLKGEPMDPGKAYKYWRTEVGKGANFNFYYSGWLATIGERMGWSSEKTAQATDKYKQRFSVAEAWRVQTIQDAQVSGYTLLPDGHRRWRFECQSEWRYLFLKKLMVVDPFETMPNYKAVCDWICNKIQKRSQNQIVNSKIQGTCATIAKRSILSIITDCMRAEKIRGRFLIPIHDELVFSIHRDDAVRFIRRGREIMLDHPDIFKKCVLDASPAVGLTFEPWDVKKAPFGQIELYECPKLPDVIDEKSWGKRLSDDEVQRVIDHLFETRDGMRKAA